MSSPAPPSQTAPHHISLMLGGFSRVHHQDDPPPLLPTGSSPPSPQLRLILQPPPGEILHLQLTNHLPQAQPLFQAPPHGITHFFPYLSFSYCFSILSIMSSPVRGPELMLYSSPKTTSMSEPPFTLLFRCNENKQGTNAIFLYIKVKKEPKKLLLLPDGTSY